MGYFRLLHEFHNTCISSGRVSVSGVTRQIVNFFVTCRETDLTYVIYIQYVPLSHVGILTYTTTMQTITTIKITFISKLFD
jgi:hypothetical protein